MKIVIVLIGRISSGKDYAGEYLAKKLGGKHVGISSSLRIIAQQRGLSESRENLIQIGKEITEKFGDSYLAQVLLENNSEDVLIISGPRQIGQLEYFRKHTKSLLIAIESDALIRYKRMKLRGKIGENISFEKFQELEGLEEGSVQKVGECMKLCDMIIENDGTLEEFEEKFKKIDFDKILGKNQSL